MELFASCEFVSDHSAQHGNTVNKDRSSKDCGKPHRCQTFGREGHEHLIFSSQCRKVKNGGLWSFTSWSERTHWRKPVPSLSTRNIRFFPGEEKNKTKHNNTHMLTQSNILIISILLKNFSCLNLKNWILLFSLFSQSVKNLKLTNESFHFKFVILTLFLNAK